MLFCVLNAFFPLASSECTQNLESLHLWAVSRRTKENVCLHWDLTFKGRDSASLGSVFQWPQGTPLPPKTTETWGALELHHPSLPARPSWQCWHFCFCFHKDYETRMVLIQNVIHFCEYTYTYSPPPASPSPKTHTHTHKRHSIQLTILSPSEVFFSQQKAGLTRTPPEGHPPPGCLWLSPLWLPQTRGQHSTTCHLVLLTAHSPVHSSMSGSFHTTTGEVSICNRDCNACKAKDSIWPFTSVPSFAIDQDGPGASWSHMLSTPKRDLGRGYPGQSQAQTEHSQLRTPSNPSQHIYPHAQHPYPGYQRQWFWQRKLGHVASGWLGNQKARLLGLYFLICKMLFMI